MSGIHVSLPAHPHAGLTGVRGREPGGRALGGALCRQHLGSLAGNVAVQLGELVQVHDARCLHHSILFVDLGGGGAKEIT